MTGLAAVSSGGPGRRARLPRLAREVPSRPAAGRRLPGHGVATVVDGGARWRR